MRPRVIVHDDGRVTRAKVARTSRCGKHAYSSRKLALQAAAEARRDTGELIQAYHCPGRCHAWHIGHPPGTRGEHCGARPT